MCVYDFLHYGKENDIASKVLAEALCFQSVRELQKQIEKERSAGAVILSDLCGGGYNLSNDPTEQQRFPGHLMPAQRTRLKMHRRLWMLPQDKKKWRGGSNE